MKNDNYEDDDGRFTFRLDKNMKAWVKHQGGSKFIRKLLLLAYKHKEKKEFVAEEEFVG